MHAACKDVFCASSPFFCVRDPDSVFCALCCPTQRSRSVSRLLCLTASPCGDLLFNPVDNFQLSFSPSRIPTNDVIWFSFTHPAYHWDISDWVPSSKLSSFEEGPGYEARLGSGAAGSATCPGDSAQELESDYYLGGYDIDSDCPSSHVEEFLGEEPLPPPLPTDEDFPELYMPITSVSSDSTLSSGSNRCQSTRQHPSQNLSPHQLPPGDTTQAAPGSSVSGATAGNADAPNCVPAAANLRTPAGTSPPSDTSTRRGLNDSERNTDLADMDELCEGVTYITDSEQQTKV